MKITVIGPGAMGLLFGGKLAACADVTLIGSNPRNLEEINANGVTIKRDGTSVTRRIPAYRGGTCKEIADVIMLFTKAYQIRDVLSQNRDMIGPDTILLTLQNGVGHDRVMREFADAAHILIGTTKQGSSRESASVIINSGLGETVFGSIAAAGEQGPDPARLEELRSVFESSGFPCAISENIRFEVWNKLMINASSSVLSGVLQVPQGYVEQNENAWLVCQDLIREICAAAAGEGAFFNAEEQILRVQDHLRKAPTGYTSIYSDIKNGRKTEVDYICGAVVRAAQEQGLRVPVQETVLRLVHAMEGRGA